MKWFVRTWVPLAIAVTGLCGLVFAAVQQNYRQSLYDPQVQMAEDAARYLATDYTPAAVVPRGQPIDVAESLAPWIAVYDEKGSVLESTGVLNGAPPQPPQGVFDYARTGRGAALASIRTWKAGGTTEDRVTWQPEQGVRSAIVAVHIVGTRGGFVVAGRNMREIESRITQLSYLVGIAWATVLITTLLAMWLGFRASRA